MDNEQNQNKNSRIIDVDLQNEMRKSFLDYSMSVIVSRALPDVRDGLKPVHRRILYTMNEDGFTPDKPYRGSHEDVVEQGKREVEAGFMPQINPISVNLADYDVIAIGTPTWWYTMAPAVLTFLTTNDFTGKTVIPFMTNGGWPGHVIKDMEENCKGAAFAHEMQIQFDSKGKDHLETSEDVITEWIGQIKMEINK